MSARTDIESAAASGERESIIALLKELMDDPIHYDFCPNGWFGALEIAIEQVEARGKK